MFAVYITHPQVHIDASVPVPQWGLSDKGRQRLAETVRKPWVGLLGRIISSDEKKAIETASILGEAVGVAPEVLPEMGENDRSATGFLLPDEFEKAADWFFAHPSESFHGWERAVDAQSRIACAAARILDRHHAETPIAFVGHGGVGTLLKCHLLGKPISRAEDQPAGGGNLYAFTLAQRRISCDWTPMESWTGAAQ